MSHISINPPWCRCAGLWLTPTALLAPCTTAILLPCAGREQELTHNHSTLTYKSSPAPFCPDNLNSATLLSVFPSHAERKGKTKQKPMQQISVCDVKCFLCLQSQFYPQTAPPPLWHSLDPNSPFSLCSPISVTPGSLPWHEKKAEKTQTQ